MASDESAQKSSQEPIPLAALSGASLRWTDSDGNRREVHFDGE
jgi:hypothetical protein